MPPALTAVNTQPGHIRMSQVCSITGLTRENLRSWNKTQPYVRARKMLWFMLKFCEGFSWPEASRMTRKDHSTAIYGVRQWAHEHLGTHPKAKEAEIAAAWAGYLAAMEFARAIWAAPVVSAAELGNTPEALGLAA